jgi:hypothetical protein
MLSLRTVNEAESNIEELKEDGEIHAQVKERQKKKKKPSFVDIDTPTATHASGKNALIPRMGMV